MKLFCLLIFLAGEALCSAQRVNCTAVIRGAITICSASGGTHYTNWQFTGVDGTVVTRAAATDAPTWKGIAVQNGTVQVKISSATGSSIQQAPLTVSARTNFTSVPTLPKQELPDYLCLTSSGAVFQKLDVASPPTEDDTRFGISCAINEYKLIYPNSAIGSGPNTGYFYVSSFTSLTQYHWTYSPDLADVNSAFYRAQCGNYKKTTGTGFISGIALKGNIVAHESGYVNGHYGQWVSTYKNPATNKGDIAESYVSVTSWAQFPKDLGRALDAVEAAIMAAASIEPCDGSSSRDANNNCAYDGPVNYRNPGGVYAQCK